MFVGAAKIILDFYGNEELSVKRRELEKLSRLVLKKLLVSLTEVDDFDDSERCAVGFALVASSPTKTRSRVKEVLDFIDAHSVARMTSDETQIYEV